MKHAIDFPCWPGELYTMETNKFFDYSTRTEVPAGRHLFMVGSAGVDVDKDGDISSEVRLYYCPDGKKTHDHQVIMVFNRFLNDLIDGVITPYEQG